MFRSIITVSILSLGAILSGSSSLAQDGGASAQGETDSVVLTKYRSNILGQERELIVHLAQGLVPQTIIVGIPNMSGTNRTFQLVPPFMRTDPANPESPTGTGDQFLEFMEKELVPFIATQYGASGTRLFAGNSRGGLLVMYSLITKPDLFAGRFCFSTPLWRENNLLVERVSASFSGKTTMKSFLYASAGENETDNIKKGNDAMAEVLKKRAPAGLVWYVERTPGVDHSLNAQMSGVSALTKWGAFATR